MGTFEVQGIVSVNDSLPYVQIRQIDDSGEEIIGFQVSPQEAREIAQNILEAATNAIYDAALIAWANEMSPDQPEMAFALVTVIRNYRADKWGLPDRPEDWRPDD